MATGHAEVGAMWIIVISFLLDLAGILLMVIASLAAIKAKKEESENARREWDELDTKRIYTLTKEGVTA